MQGVKGVFSGGPIAAGAKLALTAGAVMGLAQTFKSATPGGRDRILESAEFGFDKVALGLALGATGAVIGGGRVRDTRLAEDFPKIVDALATIPRGAALSVLTRWNDASPEEQARIEQALSTVMQDPDFRGETDLEREVIGALR